LFLISSLFIERAVDQATSSSNFAGGANIGAALGLNPVAIVTFDHATAADGVSCCRFLANSVGSVA